MLTSSKVYELVEYNNASHDVKKVYDKTKAISGLPFVLNRFKCQRNNYSLLPGNREKLRNTLPVNDVTDIFKKLNIYSVSAEKGCTDCAKTHSIFANGMGKSLLNDADFKITNSAYDFPSHSAYPVAIKLVTKAALSPASIGDNDFEKLSEAGFTAFEVKQLMAQGGFGKHAEHDCGSFQN